MTKKTDTLSYISYLSKDIVKKELEKLDAKLEVVRKTLAEGGEGLEQGVAYQQRGADYQRKQVMADCEAWMDATHCPDYLRKDNRQKAWDSCPNEYIAKVSSAVFGLKLDLSKEVEVTPEGKWVVAQHVANAMLEAKRYTLTPEEVEAYRLYEQLLNIAEQLHQRHYYITNEFGSVEDYLYRMDDEAEQLDHFLSMYVMTEAERKERIDKLGY